MSATYFFRAVKSYQKIKKFLDVLSYFARRNWAFSVNNVRKLLRKMSDEDMKIFNFDIQSLSIDEIVHNGILGGRVYLVKDPLDTLPKARRKYMMLKCAHYTLLGILLLILFQVVSMLFRFLF